MHNEQLLVAILEQNLYQLPPHWRQVAEVWLEAYWLEQLRSITEKGQWSWHIVVRNSNDDEETLIWTLRAHKPVYNQVLSKDYGGFCPSDVEVAKFLYKHAVLGADK